MRLRLNQIIQAPGSVPFDLSLDLHDLVFGVQAPFAEPVTASGVIKNVAGSEGVLTLEGTAQTTLHCACDRCATGFTAPYAVPLDALLVTELQNEEDEWTFLLEDDCVDLDEIVTTAVVFGMEPQLLCRPDCKGLCPQCGKNLNDGPCGCAKEIDPRLAVLSQLLKDK